MTQERGCGWPELCAGELVLEPTGERLWRQVHPQFVEDGIVGVGAFVGVEGDRDRVSAARELCQTARGAHEFHTEALGLRSAGTWGVRTLTVAEAGSRSVYDAESECAPAPCPPGHSYIDFRTLGRAQKRAIRLSLAAKVTAQGCDYSPV